MGPSGCGKVYTSIIGGLEDQGERYFTIGLFLVRRGCSRHWNGFKAMTCSLAVFEKAVTQCGNSMPPSMNCGRKKDAYPLAVLRGRYTSLMTNPEVLLLDTAWFTGLQVVMGKRGADW